MHAKCAYAHHSQPRVKILDVFKDKNSHKASIVVLYSAVVVLHETLISGLCFLTLTKPISDPPRPVYIYTVHNVIK